MLHSCDLGAGWIKSLARKLYNGDWRLDSRHLCAVCRYTPYYELRTANIRRHGLLLLEQFIRAVMLEQFLIKLVKKF